MAGSRRKKKTTKRRSGFTVPLGVVGGLAPVVGRGISVIQSNGWAKGLQYVGSWFTGYDGTTGKWSAKNLLYGLVPLGAGLVVHKLASKLGFNRMLAQSGIPVIRI